MFDTLHSLLAPLDYPRQSAYGLGRGLSRIGQGTAGLDDYLGMAPGIAGLAGGALFGLPGGALAAGLTQGLGKMTGLEAFDAPTPGDLLSALGGDPESFLQTMGTQLATDPLMYLGIGAGTRMARGLLGAGEARPSLAGVPRTGPVSAEALPVDMALGPRPADHPSVLGSYPQGAAEPAPFRLPPPPAYARVEPGLPPINAPSPAEYKMGMGRTYGLDQQALAEELSTGAAGTLQDAAAGAAGGRQQTGMNAILARLGLDDPLIARESNLARRPGNALPGTEAYAARLQPQIEADAASSAMAEARAALPRDTAPIDLWARRWGRPAPAAPGPGPVAVPGHGGMYQAADRLPGWTFSQEHGLISPSGEIAPGLDVPTSHQHWLEDHIGLGWSVDGTGMVTHNGTTVGHLPPYVEPAAAGWDNPFTNPNYAADMAAYDPATEPLDLVDAPASGTSTFDIATDPHWNDPYLPGRGLATDPQALQQELKHAFGQYHDILEDIKWKRPVSIADRATVIRELADKHSSLADELAGAASPWNGVPMDEALAQVQTPPWFTPEHRALLGQAHDDADLIQYLTGGVSRGPNLLRGVDNPQRLHNAGAAAMDLFEGLPEGFAGAHPGVANAPRLSRFLAGQQIPEQFMPILKELEAAGFDIDRAALTEEYRGRASDHLGRFMEDALEGLSSGQRNATEQALASLKEAIPESEFGRVHSSLMSRSRLVNSDIHGRSIEDLTRPLTDTLIQRLLEQSNIADVPTLRQQMLGSKANWFEQSLRGMLGDMLSKDTGPTFMAPGYAHELGPLSLEQSQPLFAKLQEMASGLAPQQKGAMPSALASKIPAEQLAPLVEEMMKVYRTQVRM